MGILSKHSHDQRLLIKQQVSNKQQVSSKQRIVIRYALLGAAIFLTACASKGGADGTSNAELKQQLDAQQAQLQAIKPDLERLLQLEMDYQLLVKRLETDKLFSHDQNTSVKGGDDPESVMDDYVRVQFLPRRSLSRQPDNAMMGDSTQTKQSQYAVQLGAYHKVDMLEKGWLKLNAQFTEQFADKYPVKEKFVQTKKPLWLLKIGPFEDYKSSEDFCSWLKKNKQDCLLADFSGDALFLDMLSADK